MLVMDVRKWSASHAGHFIPRDKFFPVPSGYEGECMHSTGFGKVAKKKISAPAMNETLFVQCAA
jgi:hypothetical protein